MSLSSLIKIWIGKAAAEGSRRSAVAEEQLVQEQLVGALSTVASLVCASCLWKLQRNTFAAGEFPRILLFLVCVQSAMSADPEGHRCFKIGNCLGPRSLV